MIRVSSTTIVDANGAVLLFKRSQYKGSYPNRWNFLSGTIQNETPRECIEREIIEEIGSKVSLTFLKAAESFIDKQPEGTWEVNPFLYRYNSGEIVLNPEHTEYKWVKLNQITEYNIVPGLPKNLKALGLL